MAAESKAKTDPKTHDPNFVPSDKERAQFMGNPHIDNMMTAMTAIAAELWVVKRRLKVHESLLAKHGAITQAMIETYRPTDEEFNQWKADRDRLARLVYDPFLRPADVPYDKSVNVPKSNS